MKKIMFNNRYGLTQAVLDLLKTMTRRMISEKEWDKIRKFKEEYYEQTFDRLEDKELIKTYFDTYPERMPYQVGEVVAIAQKYSEIGIEPFPFCEAGWDNKMFVRADLMPHHIRITDIKVERLQDISDEDCIKEGVETMESYAIRANGTKKILNYYRLAYRCKSGRVLTLSGSTPREVYAALIDRISGKGTWKSNPWVFAYEFELEN